MVEHNTLVGLGQGLGFGSTRWHPEQRFRYNIIANCDRPVEIYVEGWKNLEGAFLLSHPPALIFDCVFT